MVLGVRGSWTYNPNSNAQDQDLLVPPELLSSHLSRSASEGPRLAGHRIRLVNEELDTLPS